MSSRNFNLGSAGGIISTMSISKSGMGPRDFIYPEIRTLSVSLCA